MGVFNAVTDNEHSGLYKTAVALSPTQEEGAAALGMPYDLTKVEIPVLMLAGTQGEFETEMVLPLDAMTAMYDRLSVPKAMARRTDSDHGGMLYKADGLCDGLAPLAAPGERGGRESLHRREPGAHPERPVSRRARRPGGLSPRQKRSTRPLTFQVFQTAVSS